MNALERFGRQLAALWAQMSTARRVAIVVTAALAVAGAAAAAYYSSQVEYKVLFAGLTQEDAAAFVGRLQTQSVPYRLAAGGCTILVPSDQVESLKLTLGVDSANGGTGGYSGLDNISVTTPPSLLGVHVVHAQQEELAKSIRQIDPVYGAKVFIVQPEPSVFEKQKLPATASVVLKLKPGRVLNRSTARAITSLVSHAVAGLVPEKVSLVDTSGRLLMDQADGEADGMPVQQLEYKEKVERYLTKKVEDMLGRAMGANRVIIQVGADINFKRVKGKTDKVDPENRALLKETVSTSKQDGSGGGKVAGALPNTVGATARPGASASSEKREDTTAEYELSHSWEEFETMMGGVERLTVAALVDIPDGSNGKPAMTVEDVRGAVMEAIGYKQGRDEIKVTPVKLPTPEVLEAPPEEPAKPINWPSYIMMARDGAIGVAALIGMVFGLVMLVRLRAKPIKVADAAGTSGAVSPTGLEGASGDDYAAVDAALREVAAAARENPALMASLITGMMAK